MLLSSHLGEFSMTGGSHLHVGLVLGTYFSAHASC